MKSRTNPAFRKLFAALPADVREQARLAYHLFRSNPRHPGLNFKRVHGAVGFVSARVGRHHRAVGILAKSDDVVWFWIGPHEQYEKIEESVPPEIRRTVHRVAALLESVDIEFERVLAERETYRSNAAAAPSDRRLNSDLLEAVLDQLFPRRDQDVYGPTGRMRIQTDTDIP